MRISFFEEFPTARNLEKTARFPFPAIVYPLRFFRDEGVPEVTLYRLGGLTEEYLDRITEICPS